MTPRRRAVRAAAIGLFCAAAAAAQESAPSSRLAAADGLIAFSRANRVYVIGADGRGERAITADLGYERPLVWTADGSRVICWEHTAGWHLWSVDVESGARLDLTPDGGDCRSASVSPDNTLVAFMSGDAGLSVVNLDGTKRRALTKIGHRDLPPAWSPDGRKLAFTTLRSVGEHSVDEEVWAIGVDGSDLALVAGSASQPAWSRDGRTVYCIARRKAGTDVYAIEAATKAEVNLTGTPDFEEDFVSLSPDGTTLAVVAWDSGWKSCDLRVLAVDGSGKKTLAKLEGRPGVPSWSPDSKHVATSSGPDKKSNLFVFDAATGDSTQLTTAGADWPAWQPRKKK